MGLVKKGFINDDASPYIHPTRSKLNLTSNNFDGVLGFRLSPIVGDTVDRPPFYLAPVIESLGGLNRSATTSHQEHGSMTGALSLESSTKPGTSGTYADSLLSPLTCMIDQNI